MHNSPLSWISIRQAFDSTALRDVAGETRRATEACGLSIAPGSRIAIAVGSRGIASLPEIVRAAVDFTKAQGGLPFIVPAMGSHGGATAEGQREVLRGYGIDEKTLQCPVISSMDVVPLCSASTPRVYLSRDAYEADGIIVINRVKPHTDFHGPVESGLVKMLVIGLGKHAQALEMHRYGVPGLRDGIPVAARHVLQTGKILMGIGIVENAYDQVLCVRACRGQDIPETDASLLALARRSMASLPFDALDLLVVDEIGKDISGTGMDTNVIGRVRIPGEPEPDNPHIRMIVADGLTAASHGNALGMGLADVVTRRLYDAVDFAATYENVVTSGFLERGRLPIVAEDLAQAVQWAMRTLGGKAADEVTGARIASTLSLSTMQVTPAALRLLKESGMYEARNMSIPEEDAFHG